MYDWALNHFIVLFCIVFRTFVNLEPKMLLTIAFNSMEFHVSVFVASLINFSVVFSAVD